MVVVGWFLANVGLSVPVVVLLLLMFALPASEGATGLFNTLVTYMVKPARLVGYEFKDGIPEDARTLLVAPCMITSRDSVTEESEERRVGKECVSTCGSRGWP